MPVALKAATAGTMMLLGGVDKFKPKRMTALKKSNRVAGRLECRDVVEKVASRTMQVVRTEADERSWLTACHRWLPGKAGHGELAQVLGGGCEVEFVSGTVGAT